MKPHKTYEKEAHVPTMHKVLVALGSFLFCDSEHQRTHESTEDVEKSCWDTERA